MLKIQNLIGAGLVGYGAYLAKFAGEDLKGGALVVGGIVYLVMTNWELIKTGFGKISPVVVTKKVKSEQIFKPDNYEFYDTTCLVHLRNRCLANNSDEGVKVCAQLNEIIFSFKNIGDKVEKPVEVTK